VDIFCLQTRLNNYGLVSNAKEISDTLVVAHWFGPTPVILWQPTAKTSGLGKINIEEVDGLFATSHLSNNISKLNNFSTLIIIFIILNNMIMKKINFQLHTPLRGSECDPFLGT
jgi:hypothetical protein